MLLFLISFIAGVLTVLAPCVLPLLPVIVGGSVASGGGWRRAYTICVSLGGSVILFTLVLKVSTVFINIPQSFWEILSGGILILFGIVMIFPRLWDTLGFVNLMNRSSNRALAVGYQKNSLWGDMLMGAALGPVFASCSPTYFIILATVLPASFAMGLADLLAYAVGLSGFLFIIAIAGQRLVDKLGVTIEPEGWFRRVIGALFVIVGILVLTGLEKKIEAQLLSSGFDVTIVEQRLLGAPSGSSVDTAYQNPATTATSTGSSDPSTQPAQPVVSAQTKALVYKKSAELTSIDGYINTGTNTDGTPKKITIGEFKGRKVVLVDIWTYSCINCQRTLPYLKMWYDKYADQGLEIIGVHTPEFAFERVLANVQNAVTQDGLKYPVVLDNSYGTWNAFGNVYWPRKYLIDIDGYIVYDHAGEGQYVETEKAIQKALAERAVRLGVAADLPTDTNAPSGVLVVGDVGSPEIYFGSSRNEYLGNGTPGKQGAQSFEEPISVARNTLYLIGTWNIMPEYAETPASVGSPGVGSDRIDYRYYSKSVYLVAGSADGSPIDMEVLRDSKPLEKGFAGADVHFVGGKSFITVTGNRLYKVIEDSASGDHFLEFIISKPGFQAYTFTFG